MPHVSDWISHVPSMMLMFEVSLACITTLMQILDSVCGRASIESWTSEFVTSRVLSLPNVNPVLGRLEVLCPRRLRWQSRFPAVGQCRWGGRRRSERNLGTAQCDLARWRPPLNDRWRKTHCTPPHIIRHIKAVRSLATDMQW